MSNFQTPLKCEGKENISKKVLAIPPSPFLEKLGYGTGVNVWKLNPSPKNKGVKSPWAIKNIRRNVDKELSSKFQSLIHREADILQALNHENIIGFRGYLKSEDGRNCLAMEVGGESLCSMIEERFENDLGPYPADTILKVGLSVAKALDYLHSDKKILHGDIKSANIVIKNNFEEIKLCDFGVSLKLNNEGKVNNYVGTAIYSAPECLEEPQKLITVKADIYSFGLLLWEMLSLHPPHLEDLFFDDSYIDSDLNESNFEFEDSILSNNIEGKYGKRPPLPSVELGPEYLPILEIFCACTEENPEQRPTAAALVEQLEILIKKS